MRSVRVIMCVALLVGCETSPESGDAGATSDGAEPAPFDGGSGFDVSANPTCIVTGQPGCGPTVPCCSAPAVACNLGTCCNALGEPCGASFDCCAGRCTPTASGSVCR